MTLNRELLRCVRKTEAKYGMKADAWPEDVCDQLADLSWRGDTYHEEMKQRTDKMDWMFRHGFINKAIADEIGFSPAWVGYRRPKNIKFVMSLVERSELQELVARGCSNDEIARMTKHRIGWIREMRSKL